MSGSLSVEQLCPKCKDEKSSKPPYFITGEDEVCSYCSGEFYCDCGNGTTQHELETAGVCRECI